MEQKIYIFDFDSTLIVQEALDEFIQWLENERKEKLNTSLEDITNRGMDGTLPFGESLHIRVEMIKKLTGTRDDLYRFMQSNTLTLSPSIQKEIEWFRLYAQNIFIVSGGFKEFIIPIAEDLHIKKENIFCNTFTFDEDGVINGFDRSNPLSDSGGKEKVIEEIPGELIAIGDSNSDKAMRDKGKASTFYWYTENIVRKKTTEGLPPDQQIQNFQEFLTAEKMLVAAQ